LNWLSGIDRKIFDFTLKLSQDNNIHRIMRFISRSGDWGIAWILACLVLLIWPENRRTVELCFITLLFTTILGEHILKRLFKRQRPYVTHAPISLTIRTPSGFSFPSGHTASSVACARILSSINPLVAWLAYGYAALMGMSRVYLKAHYVTDVIAGGLIGIICAQAVKWYFR